MKPSVLNERVWVRPPLEVVLNAVKNDSPERVWVRPPLEVGEQCEPTVLKGLKLICV